MNIYIYVNIYKTFVDEHIHYSFMIIDYLNFLYLNEAFTVSFCKILKALVYIFLHYDWLMFIIVFPYSCTCVTHKAPSYDHLMVRKSLCVACSLSLDLYSPTVSSSWLWLFLCFVFLSGSLATRKFGFVLGPHNIRFLLIIVTQTPTVKFQDACFPCSEEGFIYLILRRYNFIFPEDHLTLLSEKRLCLCFVWIWPVHLHMAIKFLIKFPPFFRVFVWLTFNRMIISNIIIRRHLYGISSSFHCKGFLHRGHHVISSKTVYNYEYIWVLL